MDYKTPRLILKFTQNIASKCLEIVPEISCIQNLDKIDLNIDTNILEYTIPMTHKIKFEKDPKEEEHIDEDKTYHSCVDLVEDSPAIESLKNLKRMLSDSKIIPHFIDPKVLGENKTKLSVKETKNSSDGTSEQLAVYIDVPTSCHSISKISNCNKSMSADSDAKTIINELYKDAHVDFQSNTKFSPDNQSREEFIDVLRHSSTETENLGLEKRLTLSPVYSFNTPPGCYSKKNLTISPVYSMSAGENENPIYINHESKTQICPIHPVLAQCEIKIKNNELHRAVQSNNKIGLPNGKFGRFNSYYKDRIPPDVKLAYYRQLMEKEVSPLKSSLDNILEKCKVLGVHEQLLKASKSANEDVTKKASEKNQSAADVMPVATNRVVYDIIFDG